MQLTHYLLPKAPPRQASHSQPAQRLYQRLHQRHIFLGQELAANQHGMPALQVPSHKGTHRRQAHTCLPAVRCRHLSAVLSTFAHSPSAPTLPVPTHRLPAQIVASKRFTPDELAVFAESWMFREKQQCSFDGFFSTDDVSASFPWEFETLEGPNMPVPGGFQV